MSDAAPDDSELDPAELGPRAEPDARLLATVMDHFGLGPPLKTADLGGMYNLNLHTATATGEYVVRVYRPWMRPNRLALLHAIRTALAEADFPVPPPIASPTGETIARYGARLAEAERFVPHDGIADGWERYAVAFATLGRLHDFLAEAVSPDTFIPPRVENYGTPPLLLAWIAGAERRIRRAPPDAAARRALAVCAAARATLAPLQTWWRDVGHRLPRQPTHGDYGGGNLLFARDRLAAILDFDLLGVRERVFDLAYSLYWMIVRLAGDGVPAHVPWHRVRAMLAAYNAATTRPLSAAETAALPITMARVPLYWVAEARWLPDPIPAVLAMAPHVALSRWLLQHDPGLHGGSS